MDVISFKMMICQDSEFLMYGVCKAIWWLPCPLHDCTSASPVPGAAAAHSSWLSACWWPRKRVAASPPEKPSTKVLCHCSRFWTNTAVSQRRDSLLWKWTSPKKTLRLSVSVPKEMYKLCVIYDPRYWNKQFFHLIKIGAWDKLHFMQRLCLKHC